MASGAILLATDGSELSLTALRAGLAVLAPSDRVVIATVVDLVHEIEIVGTGFAGGVVSPQAAVEMDEARTQAAQELLDETKRQLELPAAETVVLHGPAGPAIVDLAADLPAAVVVIGSRGRGGLRRAVLGSVSDHIVRHSPCPVLVDSPT